MTTTTTLAETSTARAAATVPPPSAASEAAATDKSALAGILDSPSVVVTSPEAAETLQRMRQSTYETKLNTINNMVDTPEERKAKAERRAEDRAEEVERNERFAEEVERELLAERTSRTV